MTLARSRRRAHSTQRYASWLGHLRCNQSRLVDAQLFAAIVVSNGKSAAMPDYTRLTPCVGPSAVVLVVTEIDKGFLSVRSRFERLVAAEPLTALSLSCSM
jgi:hypothetical protein